ncbi:hypothetical protein GX411_09945 [Candidatus Fermentibacteria bacterium]|nr:hypothetical protein [Candidatus Fermentibacteria bacterium]
MFSSSDRAAVLMRCGNCSQALGGLPDDTVFPCTECLTAWCLGDGELVPRAMEVFAMEEDGLAALPFWILDAELEIVRRITRMAECASPVQLPRHFEEAGERGLRETADPPRRATIFVPAFLTDRPLSLGRKVTSLELAPSGRTVRGLRAPGGCITADDGLLLAKGVAIFSETGGRTHLALLELDLRPVHLRLALVGCRAEEQGFRVAGQTLLIPYTTIADAEEIMAFSGLSREGR